MLMILFDFAAAVATRTLRGGLSAISAKRPNQRASVPLPLPLQVSHAGTLPKADAGLVRPLLYLGTVMLK